MPKVARLGDQIGHGSEVTGQITSASSDTTDEGKGVARDGDTASCSKKGHGTVTISATASLTLTNGRKTARVGDPLSCGATILQGSGTRDIGDSSVTVSQSFTKPADPPVEADPVVESQNTAKTNSYVSNPSAYKNPVAAENGVKENYAGTPDTTGMVDPEPPKTCSNGHAATVVPFLQKILAEASNGLWRESGQGGRQSNQNILNIWKSLGFPQSGAWLSDQTAWCAGFVNFALKESGLAYAKEAGAQAMFAKGPSLGMTQVAIADMQPGDLVLWSFHHVNFCYTANNGKFSFVGGNQTPTGSGGNNPSDGDVTNSWKSGWTPARGQIVSVLRPGCP
jgi:uncharacterized Zn-binding protein involved in type VI secretion